MLQTKIVEYSVPFISQRRKTQYRQTDRPQMTIYCSCVLLAG